MRIRLIWLVLLLVGGCSLDRTAIKTSCEENRTVTCACMDGGIGARACNSGGWGDCICENGSQTTGDGGNADNSGNGGGEGGSGPVDTDSGAKIIDAGRMDAGGDARASMDSGAPGPDAGSVDSGLDARPLDSGAPDAGKDSGTDAGEPDAGADAGGTVVYGPCHSGSCNAGQECVHDLNDAGAYCSVGCAAVDENCPEPTTGTAVRRCSSVDDMCRLNCADGGICPPGMECNETLLGSRLTCVWR